MGASSCSRHFACKIGDGASGALLGGKEQMASKNACASAPCCRSEPTMQGSDPSTGMRMILEPLVAYPPAPFPQTTLEKLPTQILPKDEQRIYCPRNSTIFKWPCARHCSPPCDSLRSLRRLPSFRKICRTQWLGLVYPWWTLGFNMCSTSGARSC